MADLMVVWMVVWRVGLLVELKAVVMGESMVGQLVDWTVD